MDGYTLIISSVGRMLQKQIILFLSFLVLALPAGSAQAQENDTLPPVTNGAVIPPQTAAIAGAEILPDVKMHPKTNPERIIFAHYKLSKNTPDFDEFAKKSPLVKKAQDIDKQAMAFAEYNRMTNRFNLLDPKEPVSVHVLLDLDEYSSLQNIIAFDELNEKTYFKFPVYDENIAIVPKDIHRFNRIQMPKENANKMFADLRGSSKIMAEFILVPEYADRKEPFVFEDTSYWLMLAEIAEIRLWSDTGDEPKLAWYYRAADYTPTDKEGLGRLYSQE